jgi:hypothetical protein
MLTEDDIAEFRERGFLTLRGRFRTRAAELHRELERLLGSLE